MLLALASAWTLPASAHDWIYSARPGDNIWNLTERYLTEIRYWKLLQSYNNLADPDRILPGTRLRIPIRWLKVQPAAARVIAVRGEVQRVDGTDGSLHAAVAGDELRSGDGIRTGADSSATVEFADRSRLLVQHGTDLVMDSMSVYGTTGMVDTTMRLHKGRIENEVQPAAGEASRYQIITPSAVVAVRGTSFRSAFDDETETALGEVTEGALAFSGAGRERRVPAGFGVRAVRGRAPEPPRPLLPAPALDGLPERATALLVALAWPAVEGARGYRVQVFPAADPARLLLDVEVDGPAVEFDAPPDGEYRVRVRGIDAAGLEGLDSDRALVVDARPVPPALLGPPDDARMHGVAPELWWSEPEGITRFHVQLATDPGFSNLVLNREAFEGTRVQLAEEPAPGTYHWRIASVSAAGEQGPFSSARQFTVQAVPAATPASSSVSDGQAVISWSRAANAKEYEFELARDKEFEDKVVAKTLPGTELVLPDVGTGVFYFRVRGVSAEGVAGPFAAVNRLEIPGEPLSPAWLLLLAPLLLLL